MSKKTKKTKKAKPVSAALVRQVINECAVAVGQGIEAVAQTKGVTIEVKSEAAMAWAKEFEKSVKKGMGKVPWKRARPAVLEASRLLGKFAAEAALARQPGQAAVDIDKSDARKAADEIRDPTATTKCQALPKGSGKYCDIAP
jgi:hypothetical protein